MAFTAKQVTASLHRSSLISLVFSPTSTMLLFITSISFNLFFFRHYHIYTFAHNYVYSKYAHTYTRIDISIDMDTHTSARTHIYPLIHAYLYIYIYIYICPNRYAHSHVDICIPSQISLYQDTYALTHTYMTPWCQYSPREFNASRFQEQILICTYIICAYTIGQHGQKNSSSCQIRSGSPFTAKSCPVCYSFCDSLLLSLIK